MTDEMKEFLKDLDKQTSWAPARIKQMLQQRGVPIDSLGYKSTVEELKLGDVISSQWGAHPAVVIKIEGNTVLSVLISTKDGDYTVYQTKHSRFFRGNFVSMTISTMPIELAKKKFIGSLDSPEDLEAIMFALRQRYKDLFRKTPKKVKEERVSGVTFMEFEGID